MFDQLARAVAELEGAGLDALSAEECNDAIAQLHALKARVDAQVARLTGAWDARRCWQVDGARNGSAWLSWRCRLVGHEARRRVRLGRALRDMPASAAAWNAGEISEAHVNALARLRTPATEGAFARDEVLLVDSARTLRFSHFARVIDYWMLHTDPDGAESAAEHQVQLRRVHLSQSFRGMWFGDTVLDPMSGAAVHGVLSSIEAELFEADWTRARAEHGDAVTASDLWRTPAQRRADALVEMAIRAAAAPRDGKRPAPLFSVLVGYETFAGRMCELASGHVVTPGSLLRWLEPALIERIVFDGPSRVMDVGRQRFFRGALRRAIEVRDRECFEPTCEDRDCLEIDHRRPWALGGETTQANGRPACDYHNRSRGERPNRGPLGPERPGGPGRRRPEPPKA